MLPNLVQWFEFEDRAAVGRAIPYCRELSVSMLRVNASWADWERPGGVEWFEFLFGRFRQEGIELLPNMFYTPLSLASKDAAGKLLTSNPPRDPLHYGEFMRWFLRNHGDCCNWVQIWNEPNNSAYWNQSMDPDGRIFAEMADYAISVAHEFGKKVVLGGLSPTDYTWIQRMFDFGILGKCEALGTHAFEGTWSRNRNPEQPEMPWQGWDEEVAGQRRLFAQNGFPDIQVWITETGYSTWGSMQERADREPKQVEYFQELLGVPADQVFWYSLFDQRPGSTTDNVLNMGKELDDRAFHFGLIDPNGRPKALYEVWRNQSLRKAA